MKELSTTKKPQTVKTSGKLLAWLKITAIITSHSVIRMFYFASQSFITINLLLQSLAVRQPSWAAEVCRQIHYNEQLPRQSSGATCYTSQSAEVSALSPAAVIYHSFGSRSGPKPCKKGQSWSRLHRKALGLPCPAPLLHSTGQVRVRTHGFAHLRAGKSRSRRTRAQPGQGPAHNALLCERLPASHGEPRTRCRSGY